MRQGRRRGDTRKLPVHVSVGYNFCAIRAFEINSGYMTIEQAVYRMRFPLDRPPIKRITVRQWRK